MPKEVRWAARIALLVPLLSAATCTRGQNDSAETAEQIQASQDCGLVKLDVETARAKLAAMVEGARLAREQYGS